jgi:hypothetical protein
VVESIAKDKRTVLEEGATSNTIMEWEGNESELSEPFNGVMTSTDEWDSLWMRAFGKKAPPVDFGEYAVACVFLGHYPGWWYKINIFEPAPEGESLIVGYELVSLVVEDQGDPAFRNHGSRGQYRMKVVKRKPGVAF